MCSGKFLQCQTMMNVLKCLLFVQFISISAIRQRQSKNIQICRTNLATKGQSKRQTIGKQSYDNSNRKKSFGADEASKWIWNWQAAIESEQSDADAKHNDRGAKTKKKERNEERRIINADRQSNRSKRITKNDNGFGEQQQISFVSGHGYRCHLKEHRIFLYCIQRYRITRSKLESDGKFNLRIVLRTKLVKPRQFKVNTKWKTK